MPSERPNVLVITTHDTGRHLGCYGVGTVHSENIDALAADGVMLESYFAAGALCTPSRACQMTGLWPQTNGVMHLCHSPFHWKYKPGVRHLSHILRDAGYHTTLFMFQHEADDAGELGFVEQVHVPPHKKDEMPAIDAHLPANEVARDVDAFLRCRQAGDPPFYAQVGFFETHYPWDFGGVGPDDEKGVYIPPYIVDNATARRRFAEFQGSIRKADEAVGMIRKSLDETHLSENTIVVYTTDHGISMPRAKATLYDSGIGIACVFRYPRGGMVGGQRRRQLLSNVDFTPTILELCGLEIPGEIQGRSFAGVLTDDAPSPRDAVFSEVTMDRHPRCVRTDRYKLIRNFQPDRLHKAPIDMSNSKYRHKEVPYCQMFDLAADPWELNDVADDPAYAEARADLNRRLMQWMREVNDPLLDGPIRWPYYEAALADFQTSTKG